MAENSLSTPTTGTTQNLEALSNEERQFVQKANNAGLAVSFTPQGASSALTFLPSSAQIKNATASRQSSPNPEQGLPYTMLLKGKESQAGIGIISEEEAEQIPYLPNMRQSFFATIPPETKRLVLRANLSGLNITAKGSNGKSFLYLAAQNDQARALMRQELQALETQTANPFENTPRVSAEPTPAPLTALKTNQHQ